MFPTYCLTCVPPTLTILSMKLTLETFRQWGKQGGAKRAKNLSTKQRQESARKAALARWHKKGEKP